MDRKNFLLDLKYKVVINKMSDEQAGVLMKAIFEYVATGDAPTWLKDVQIETAFDFIKLDLDYNNDKWKETVQKRREAGSLGGKQKVANLANVANVANASKPKQIKQKVANLADNVVDVVNDSVSDNEKDITTNDSCSEQQTAVATEPPADSAEIEYSAEECEEAILPHGEKAERESSDTGEISVPEELKGLPLYMADDKLCKRWPELIAAWKVSYPGVNIHAEVSKAHAWEVANPKKRKVDRPRFLNTWLAKEQDRGGKVIGGRVKGQYEDGYKFKE